MNDLFLLRYGEEILQRSWEHILLVGSAIAIAICLGVPLGVAAVRYPRLRQGILSLANLFQTIPSLAMFGLLIPLVGIGVTPAIIALSLYSLLPIIRNTYTGITTIEPSILEAGKPMGMNSRQLLWQVEFPLALSIIFAGIRIATVIAVGIATVGAAIGAGGLGELIFRGIAALDDQLILAGAVPAGIMALIADFGIGLIADSFRPR